MAIPPIVIAAAANPAVRKVAKAAAKGAAAYVMAKRPGGKRLAPVYRALAKDRHLKAGESGARARFTYRDALGRTSQRTVRDWRSDGKRVFGICETSGKDRDFRVGRMSEWTELG